MSTFRNVFACLVHDSQECVIDLVRNLRYLDPDSAVLLYNGGRDDRLLTGGFPFERYGAIVHPNPRPLEWGRLHDFALDCMRFAIDHLSFDALTIVDSDQLGARPGYSAHLARFFAAQPRLGLAGNSACVQRRNTRVGPAAAALREIDLWRPLLSRFPRGIDQYPHWVFWPSTIFSAPAARDLTCLFDTDPLLKDIMGRSQIWASEEVIFPTLVALLGYQVTESPCTYNYVKHRVAYTRRELDRAFADPSAFWIHPINRRYDDALRSHVRIRFKHYDSHCRQYDPPVTGGLTQLPDRVAIAPILERMQTIEGWLDDDEAGLLIAATASVVSELPEPHTVVEIGSYCGRATVVLGSVIKALGTTGQIHAIDPHDGIVGALDTGLQTLPPTLGRFEQTVAAADLRDWIVSIPRRPGEVSWDRPISLLLIDGLHDYPNVARDFHNFEDHLVPGGLVAFHDYADYFPGVKAFVNGLLATGNYESIGRVRSMMVVRKTTGDGTDAGADRALSMTSAGAARARYPPAGVARSDASSQPLVSCIMPTLNRPLFVPQAIRCFLRQDYANKELIIIDDGAAPTTAGRPSHEAIRYVSIDHRLTLGEKRNLAADLSRGDIIAHWDDDDWYAPGYLTNLAAELLRGGPEILTGLSRYLVYMLASGRLNICLATAPAGASFCYWKSLWLRHPYRHTERAEDYFFLKDALPTLRPITNQELFAIVRHRNHTWVSTNGRDVDRCLGALPAYHRTLEMVMSNEDTAFYAAARQTLFGPTGVSR